MPGLSRSAADPRSALYGIDEATTNRLLEIVAVGVPVEVDRLLDGWKTFTARVASNDPQVTAIEVAAALESRDALAQVASMLPPSRSALAAQLRPADRVFWDGSVDLGDPHVNSPQHWRIPRWWHTRTPRTVASDFAIGPSADLIKPSTHGRTVALERVLFFRRRSSDLATAQRALRDADFPSLHSAAPNEREFYGALAELRRLTEVAVPRPVAAARVLGGGSLPPGSDPSWFGPAPVPELATSDPEDWPRSTEPAAVERARTASLLALDALLTNIPGPDHGKPPPRGSSARADDPLGFATALAWGQDARDRVRDWAADPESLLFGIDDQLVSRLVDLVMPISRFSEPEYRLSGWEDRTGWSGLEPSTGNLDYQEFVDSPGARSSVAALELVLPPTLDTFVARLLAADLRWERRTIGVGIAVGHVYRESVAPWWHRRVPRYLPSGFTVVLAGANPEVWAELKERGIATDPEVNPELPLWKERLGMTIEEYPVGEQLPTPLSRVLGATEPGGTFSDVRSRLARWALGGPYAVPTEAQIEDGLREIARMVETTQPRPATLEALLAKRGVTSRGGIEACPWIGQQNGLELARAASSERLSRVLTGSWDKSWLDPPRGALDLAFHLTAELELANNLHAAAEDPSSVIYGLSEADRNLLVDARVGQRVYQRFTDYFPGQLDFWQAGQSFVDVRIAAWERLIQWAEAGPGRPSLGRYEHRGLLDERAYLGGLAQVFPPLHAPLHDRLRALDARYWAATEPRPYDPEFPNSQPADGEWWWHRTPTLLGVEEREGWLS